MKQIGNIKANVTKENVITVDIQSVDIIDFYKKHLISNFKIEEPTKLTARKFQTSCNFVPSTLMVYLNGIKEKYINIIDNNTFEFEIDITDNNIVEVSFIEEQ